MHSRSTGRRKNVHCSPYDLRAATSWQACGYNIEQPSCDLPTPERSSEARGSRWYRFRGVKVGGDEEDNKDLHERIECVESASKLFTGAQLPNLIGGTAWAFSHIAAQGTLDYLFVDEAGQVSVANFLGMAPSTRNIILIGDQMQLSQPIKGSHPGESGTSTLEYLLQAHATIPDDLGIFLGETWRMHPEVCRFISGAVYEDRLKPKPLTAAGRLAFGWAGAATFNRVRA